MNRVYVSSSSFISASGTKTTGRSLQKFNAHDHFGNLIFFKKVTLNENEESLARGWIYYP